MMSPQGISRRPEPWHTVPEPAACRAEGEVASTPAEQVPGMLLSSLFLRPARAVVGRTQLSILGSRAHPHSGHVLRWLDVGPPYLLAPTSPVFLDPEHSADGGGKERWREGRSMGDEGGLCVCLGPRWSYCWKSQSHSPFLSLQASYMGLGSPSSPNSVMNPALSTLTRHPTAMSNIFGKTPWTVCRGAPQRSHPKRSSGARE